MTNRNNPRVVGLIVDVLLGIGALALLVQCQSGVTTQDNQAKSSALSAAARLAGSVNAAVIETLEKPYPWGVVRVFEGKSSNGERIVIEVDERTNAISSFETYGRVPARVLVDQATAFTVAKQFISQFSPVVKLNDLNMTVSFPRDNQIDKSYRFEWQGIASSGALLPGHIVVYVNAETGKVSDYINTNIPVKVDTSPRITKEQAKQIADKASGDLAKYATIGVPSLSIIPDSSVSIGQRLVWFIPFLAQGALPNSVPVQYLTVDAHSGELVSVDDHQNSGNSGMASAGQMPSTPVARKQGEQILGQNQPPSPAAQSRTVKPTFPSNLPAALGAAGRIVFTSERDGNKNIYIMNADGTDQRRLTTSSSDDYQPFGSPDGRQIAFTSERDGNYEIYAMNADGLNQHNLTQNPSWDWFPAWSPDRHLIVFSSDRGGSPQIYVMSADGTNPRKLTENNGMNEEPMWSPDSRQIGFVLAFDKHADIYLMNPDGTGQRKVTNNPSLNWYFSWSPDSRKIAFTSERDGNGEIYLMNADGSNARNLTNNGATDWMPSWSPDGASIAFVSDRDGTSQIYLMNSDGTNMHRLTNGPSDNYEPAWLPSR